MAQEKGSPADGQLLYVRQEDESVRAFYKAYAKFMSPTPEELDRFVARLAADSGLPRHAEEYPADLESIRRAAEALQRAAKELHGFELSLESADAAHIDAYINTHLVPAEVRPYFEGPHMKGELSEKEAEEYSAKLERAGVPNEPLLYYALGAFWGEWLVRHREAAWALHPPVRPIQAFPDFITAEGTVCVHPFSQVVQKLTDPEGDSLAFTAHAFPSNLFPPYPLIASLADAEQAARSALPVEGREALQKEAEQDFGAAVQLYARAIEKDPRNLRLLALASLAAFRTQQLREVETWSLQALELSPKHPRLNHNLAVLYSNTRQGLPRARQLLEIALASDPGYARAHLTLSSVLLDLGERQEAREHAEWVREHDSSLRAEAEELLSRIGQSGE